MENGRELQQSWEYYGTLPLRVNLSSGEIFQADEYRLLKTSVIFYLDGEIQAQTPISNVWHFVA